jgi:diguanylate cyclase (GGDEF)-like protein
MKIGDSKPVGPGPATRVPKTASPASVVRAQPVDTASILSIPESELTPKVRAAITTLMAEVDRLRDELDRTQRRYEELERDANLDPLVPVLNRRAFVREMSRLISFSGRYNMAASLVYFDLNAFKTLNDTYGHAAGDAALLHIGDLLRAHVRESDVVGRLGGDEFGIILANASDEVAQKKARSLAELLAANPLNLDGQTLSLSAAFGTYEFKPGETAQLAMANADLAMFKQKRSMKAGG